mmetsp:Transcript_18844/g.38267  ORF Transcript_18844/g.38267 Transcript_18844/m.38267 type:complete len:90 (-) Transcript_18844:665-934(-)
MPRKTSEWHDGDYDDDHHASNHRSRMIDVHSTVWSQSRTSTPFDTGESLLGNSGKVTHPVISSVLHLAEVGGRKQDDEKDDSTTASIRG